ncbi:MAG: hypothetical protein M1378_00570, partial [Bacteroidetes bacterium]|nr:hypothetical protein [Bacteroidota bacterium]
SRGAYPIKGYHNARAMKLVVASSLGERLFLACYAFVDARPCPFPLLFARKLTRHFVSRNSFKESQPTFPGART